MPNLKNEAKDEAKEIADDIRGNIWARLRPKIVNGGAAIVEKVGMKVLAPVILIIMGGSGLAVAEQTTDFQPVSNFSSVVVSAATEGTEKDAEQFALLEGQMASSTAAMLDLTNAFHEFVLDITPRINRADPFGDPRSLGTDCSGQQLESIAFLNIDVMGSNGVDILGTDGTSSIGMSSLTFTNLSAPNFAATDGEVGSLSITDTETDGYAITSAPGTTTAPTLGGSVRPALVYGSATERTTADHLFVKALTADCIVGPITFTDIRVSGGNVTLDEFVVGGAFTVVDSAIGDGDGPGTVDFDIASSVLVSGAQTVTGVNHFGGIHIR